MKKLESYTLGIVGGSFIGILSYYLLQRIYLSIFDYYCYGEIEPTLFGGCIHINLLIISFLVCLPFSFGTAILGCFVVDKFYKRTDSNLPIVIGGLIGSLVWIFPYLLFILINPFDLVFPS
jgi:hypothetical protein